jgi:hypothetical protein
MMVFISWAVVNEANRLSFDEDVLRVKICQFNRGPRVMLVIRRFMSTTCSAEIPTIDRTGKWMFHPSLKLLWNFPLTISSAAL